MSPRVSLARALPALLLSSAGLSTGWSASPIVAEPPLPLLAQVAPPPAVEPGTPAQIAPAPAGAVPPVEPPSLVAPAPADAAAPAKPSRSESVTINLINRLVEKGILTKDDSKELLQMAQEDAAAARQEQEAQQQVAINSAVATALEHAQASGQLGGAPAPAPEEAFEDESSVRVTYIPETVRQQLRDELRADVMAQARDERWAAPRLMPEWATKIRLFGDIRTRYEGDYFPEGNDNTGSFPNFNAINTGAPFDTAGTVFSPQINVDEDRHRVRLRLRLGMEVDLDYGFTMGVRIATGDSNSPVSTNQSLGLARDGQGGQFSKYAIWLDRAFLKYDLAYEDFKFNASLGRFNNPFFATEMMWDDDLGFDGIAFNAQYKVTDWFTPWITGGAFVIFNTDLNFSSNRPDKFRSDDKYLYGGQIGFDLKPAKDWKVKFGTALYHFDNVEGQLSDPYVPLNAQDQGNTDGTRPSFAQKGNTYRPLRNIVSSPLNNFGTTNQFQYFGLATPFTELAFTGRVDYTGWDPFQVSLTAEYFQNLAYNSETLNNFGVNNRGPDDSAGNPGDYEGGNQAYNISLRLGRLAMAKQWDWVVGANYRYLESDSMVDGFVDSAFGLGGTNQKGYTVFAGLNLTPNISLFLRYMSSDEIAGPQLKTDIFQVDFNGRF